MNKRINKLERFTDVRRMTDEQLYKIAARCPENIHDKLKTMTDQELRKITGGDLTPLKGIK